MKSEIVNSHKDLKFPKLMESKVHEGKIVLFISIRNGFIVSCGVGGDHVGYHSSSWDMSTFTDFTGKIQLSND